MAKTDIFNPRRYPRLLRTEIPVAENMTTLALFVALIGIVIWVMAQKNNYNPADRDISIELLLQDSSDLKLYTPPLKTWAEPGSVVATSAVAQLGIFPAAITDAQWQAKTSVKQFGPDNLFEKINGEAPKFLKQGFQTLHYLVLQSAADDSEIAIELFDQSDMAGSRGVFSEHLSSGKTIEQQDSVTFFRTSIGVIGRVGQYFFRTAGDSDSELIQQKSQHLIEVFASLQPAEKSSQELAGQQQETVSESSEQTNEQPLELRILEQLNVSEALISFQSENVFQYDFAENFWFGKFAQDDIARVFIHQADSTEQAQELYALLLEEQSYEYQIIDEAESHAILFHEFLKNFFAVGMQRNFIVGIENAADQERALAILQEFQEIILAQNE